MLRHSLNSFLPPSATSTFSLSILPTRRFIVSASISSRETFVDSLSSQEPAISSARFETPKISGRWKPTCLYYTQDKCTMVNSPYQVSQFAYSIHRIYIFLQILFDFSALVWSLKCFDFRFPVSVSTLPWIADRFLLHLHIRWLPDCLYDSQTTRTYNGQKSLSNPEIKLWFWKKLCSSCLYRLLFFRFFFPILCRLRSQQSAIIWMFCFRFEVGRNSFDSRMYSINRSITGLILIFVSCYFVLIFVQVM